MPRGKFRGKTSYGQQFHSKTVSPVQEFRCTTEMSKPGGEISFSTTTRDLPFHTYGYSDSEELLFVILWTFSVAVLLTSVAVAIVHNFWWKIFALAAKWKICQSSSGSTRKHRKISNLTYDNFTIYKFTL